MLQLVHFIILWKESSLWGEAPEDCGKNWNVERRDNVGTLPERRVSATAVQLGGWDSVSRRRVCVHSSAPCVTVVRVFLSEALIALRGHGSGDRSCTETSWSRLQCLGNRGEAVGTLLYTHLADITLPPTPYCLEASISLASANHSFGNTPFSWFTGNTLLEGHK